MLDLGNIQRADIQQGGKYKGHATQATHAVRIIYNVHSSCCRLHTLVDNTTFGKREGEKCCIRPRGDCSDCYEGKSDGVGDGGVVLEQSMRIHSY